MAHRHGTCTAAAFLALLASAAVAAPSEAATLFTVRGGGWGHGIGLSQWGALGYAQHGRGTEWILRHYYRGAHVGSLRAAESGRQRILLARAPAIRVAGGGRLTVVSASGRRRRVGAGEWRVRPGTVPGRIRIFRPGARRATVANLRAPVELVPATPPTRIDTATVHGVTGGQWRGRFRVHRDGGALLLVNVVGMDRYLAGVVPAEVPSSWPAAALRAQAIAARSYAVATAGGALYDHLPDTRSQMYLPVEHESARTTRAVRRTARRVVRYGGSVAVTYFHSSSGGRTASVEAAWGAAGRPYLRSVSDRYDRAGGANPNHRWRETLRPAPLRSALGVRDVGRISLRVDGPSRRVLSVAVGTPAGRVVRSGLSVQSALGLRSTWFRIRRVTLRAERTRIRRGGKTRVRGRLEPRFVRRATLVARSGDGPFRRRVRMRVRGDGHFAATVSPRRTTTYRLRLAGAASPTVRVRVGR